MASKDVHEWTVEEVGAWLAENGLGHLAETFQDEAVDGEVLLQLQIDELKDLGLKLGDRKKVMTRVATLTSPQASLGKSDEGRAFSPRVSFDLNAPSGQATPSTEAAPVIGVKNTFIHVCMDYDDEETDDDDAAVDHGRSNDDIQDLADALRESCGCQEPLPPVCPSYPLVVRGPSSPASSTTTPTETSEEQDALQRFMSCLEWDWEWMLFDNPVYGSQAGFHNHDDHLQQMTPESFQCRANHAAHLRDRLDSIIESAALPPDAAVQCKMLAEQLKEEEDAIAIGAHFTLMLNSVGHGGIVWNLLEATEWMKFQTPQDFDLLRRRLEAFPLQVSGFLRLLRESLMVGQRPPKDVINQVPDQIRALITKTPGRFIAIQQMTEAPEQQRELVDAVQKGWVKGLELLLTFVEEEYLKASVPDLGLCAQPRGNEIYNSYLRHHTTTSLTPQDVHRIGLEEVERIQRRFATDVFDKLGHRGTVREFVDRLKGDSQFFFSSAEGLVENYRALLRKIDGYLPRLFEAVPAGEIEVVPRTVGPACIYIAGTADGSRPGRFYVNTEPLEARPRYEQVAFALHEGMPGHHLQNGLCIENESLPNFLRLVEERRYEWIPARRQAYTAYQEGWALYAESLGEEMGTPGTPNAVYGDEYDIFGKLSMEMKRAVRLVVDTGIHAMGWDLEKSVAYMEDATGMHRVECERECRRYAAWPGQAVSYKIGHLCFLGLRKHAEAELGESFDIKWFHTECLRHGPMPLGLLETEIKAAVVQKKKAGASSLSGYPT